MNVSTGDSLPTLIVPNEVRALLTVSFVLSPYLQHVIFPFRADTSGSPSHTDE